MIRNKIALPHSRTPRTKALGYVIEAHKELKIGLMEQSWRWKEEAQQSLGDCAVAIRETNEAGKYTRQKEGMVQDHRHHFFCTRPGAFFVLVLQRVVSF
jgi:RNase P/RNase MRP subunit POP5